MRPASSLVQLAVCLSSLAPLSSAWPGWLPDRDAIMVRAESDSGKQSATPTEDSATSTPTNGDTASVETATKTDGGKSGKGGSLNTAKPKTGTDTNTATGTGTDTGTKDQTTATQTSFRADAPVGIVSMITPNTVLQPTPLFKIGDYVTLDWNYTSLLGPPKAIDVLLSCSTASETWTLTSNMTFATSASYLWDTSVQGDSVESPLLTAMYTLIVKDSDAEITDVPKAGLLGTYTGFKFGMYLKQDYQPLQNWTCPGGCSAASINGHALGFVMTMCLVTVLSFTWFVSGLGLQ